MEHRSACILPFRAFVDTKYTHWLKNPIPPRLLADLRREFGPNLEGVPWDTPVSELFGDGHESGRFDTYLTDAFVSAHDERLPFHGMKHAQRSACLAHDGMGCIEQRIGYLPRKLYQAAMCGYALHDLGHCGAAFFALAKPGRIPRGANVNMPVEVYTGTLVDDFLMEHGIYDPLSRLVANYVVISSAFGAMNRKHGRRLWIHRVKPQAILGTLMRVSDVLPSSDFIDTINAEADLMFREIPAVPAPLNWQGYIGNRGNFLEYVGAMMNSLDDTLQRWLDPQGPTYEVTRELGWRARLINASDDLAEARQGGPRSAVVRSTLIIRGAVLT